MVYIVSLPKVDGHLWEEQVWIPNNTKAITLKFSNNQNLLIILEKRSLLALQVIPHLTSPCLAVGRDDGVQARCALSSAS